MTTTGSIDQSFLEWLQDLSLTEYLPLLVENHLNTISSISLTTKEELKEIGIRKIGHLNRLYKAVEKLQNSSPAVTNTDTANQPSVVAPGNDSSVSTCSSTSQSTDGRIAPPVPMRRASQRRSPSPRLEVMSMTEEALQGFAPTLPMSDPASLSARAPMKRARSLRNPDTKQDNVSKVGTLPVRATSPLSAPSITDTPTQLNSANATNSSQGVAANKSHPQSGSSRRGLGVPPPPPVRTSSKKVPDYTPPQFDPPPTQIAEEASPTSTSAPILPPKGIPLSNYPPSRQPQLNSWDELLKGEVTKTSSLSREEVPLPLDTPPDAPSKLLPPSHQPPPPPSVESFPSPPPLSELPPDPPPLIPRKSAVPNFAPPPPINEEDTLIQRDTPTIGETTLSPVDDSMSPNHTTPPFSPSPPPLSVPPTSPCSPPYISSSLSPSHVSSSSPPPSPSRNSLSPSSSSTLPPSRPAPSRPLPPALPPRTCSTLSSKAPPVVKPSVLVTDEPPPLLPRRSVHSLPPPPPPPITDEDYPEDDSDDEMEVKIVTVAQLKPSAEDDTLITIRGSSFDEEGSATPLSSSSSKDLMQISQSASHFDSDTDIDIDATPQGLSTLRRAATPRSHQLTSADEYYLDMDVDVSLPTAGDAPQGPSTLRRSEPVQSPLSDENYLDMDNDMALPATPPVTEPDQDVYEPIDTSIPLPGNTDMYEAFDESKGPVQIGLPSPQKILDNQSPLKMGVNSQNRGGVEMEASPNPVPLPPRSLPQVPKEEEILSSTYETIDPNKPRALPVHRPIPEPIDTSEPLPGNMEYEAIDGNKSPVERGLPLAHVSPKRGMDSGGVDVGWSPNPVPLPPRSSLPPLPEGQETESSTYETIDSVKPRALPPKPYQEHVVTSSNGLYEAVLDKTPSPLSSSSSPNKNLPGSTDAITQSYNEFREETDSVGPIRHTDRPQRGGAHFASVKDIARDLEKEAMKQQLRPVLSESGIIQIRADETISPAASRVLSYEGVPPTKEGYLYKKGGKRNDKPYQKRWVVFDGEDLKYFKSKGEKESDARNNVKLSEMIDIKRVSDPDHNCRFDLVVINRVFQFYTDTDDDAQMWVSVLHAAISKFNPSDELICKVGGNMNQPDKEGFIMKQGHGRFAGFRQRYVALKGSKFAYYDSKEDFTQGKPIHVLDMRLAMVKPESGGKCRFTITMPNQRSYVFQASSDANRMEWIEKLSNAILTGLNLAPEQKEGKKGVRAADIIAKIQENPSNKKCADCDCEDPSWGVVNRGIMVCIECSGVHRAMGVHISKVRSVELDTEIWTDTLIKLFNRIGNYSANLYWERHFKGERLPADSPREIRESFIRSKYESKSWIPEFTSNTQEVLNKDLCVAVTSDDLLRTTELLVMGADPCYKLTDAADPDINTPLAIAQANNQPLQVELLEQNGALIESFDTSSVVQVNKRGYLHKTGSDRQGWRRRYCSVDNHRGLEYFKSDTDPEILGTIRCEDILGVSQCEDDSNGRGYCFEVITAGRAYLFAADSEHEMTDWISTIKQIIPKDAADKLGYDKVGYLRKKSPKHVTWRRRWFALKCRTLTYFKKGQEEIASIDLRTVTELRGPSESTGSGFEVQCTIQIVTSERTYTLRADTPNEAESWIQALRQTQASIPLSEHALTTSSSIPVIVHKCLQFIESSGLQAEGLYRKSGEFAKIRKLLLAFNQDPRSVMIDEDNYSVHDVTGVLKQFFRTLPDPLFTHKLYQAFIHASLMTADHENQMYQLQSLIDQLPEVNRETLKKLIGHLLKVIQNEADNKMSQSNIISLFGPTLMTVDGDAISFEDSRAQYACINHMLNYYKWLFNVNEEEEKKEVAMQSALLKIQAAQQQHKESTLMSSATSFLISIYITNKEGGTCSMKITATTTAAEVVEFVTTTKNMTKRNYALFLVLGDAESERPLHSLEHVLPVQRPDSYLCIKPNTFADKLLHYDDAYKGQCVSLHVQEKKKWRKCPCRVRDGMFIIYKDSKAHNELSRINLAELDIFVGIEQKRIDVRNPLPTRYPFCLLVRFEEQSKFLCADSADDRLLILSAVIYAKHPDGVQTPLMPIKTTPTHFDARNRGISILNPMGSPNTSPVHTSFGSPSYQPVIPRVSHTAGGIKEHGIVEELKKRNSLSPDRVLS